MTQVFSFGVTCALESCFLAGQKNPMIMMLACWKELDRELLAAKPEELPPVARKAPLRQWNDLEKTLSLRHGLRMLLGAH